MGIEPYDKKGGSNGWSVARRRHDHQSSCQCRTDGQPFGLFLTVGRRSIVCPTRSGGSLIEATRPNIPDMEIAQRVWSNVTRSGIGTANGSRAYSGVWNLAKRRELPRLISHESFLSSVFCATVLVRPHSVCPVLITGPNAALLKRSTLRSVTRNWPPQSSGLLTYM